MFATSATPGYTSNVVRLTVLIDAVTAPGMSAHAKDTGSCHCRRTASVGVVPDTADTLIKNVPPLALAFVSVAPLPAAVFALDASTDAPATVKGEIVPPVIDVTVAVTVPDTLALKFAAVGLATI